MNETLTAFVISLEHDSATIARALRAAGYRVVDPHELPEVDPVELLDGCDIAVVGPGGEKIAGEAVYTRIISTLKPSHHIAALVPGWQSA